MNNRTLNLKKSSILLPALRMSDRKNRDEKREAMRRNGQTMRRRWNDYPDEPILGVGNKNKDTWDPSTPSGHDSTTRNSISSFARQGYLVGNGSDFVDTNQNSYRPPWQIRAKRLHRARREKAHHQNMQLHGAR